MIIHLPSTLLSAAVAIAMAYTGFGVWSLVTQQLVMRFAYAMQIWFYSKWKPLLSFNTQKAKGLFSFGSRLMISGTIHKVYQNIYLIVIGKFFPVNMLGYYKVAYSLTKTPTRTLAGAVKSVTFPAFSSIQEDNKRLKKGYKKTIKLMFYLVCPLMALTAVLANPLFSFVLTEKWLPAVPFFRILCVIGIFVPLQQFNLEIINVKGRTDLFLRLALIKKTISTLGIFIALPFGIWALLSWQTCYTFIAYGINSYYSGVFIDYNLKEQLKDIAPIFLLSIGTASLVLLVNYISSDLSNILRLVIGFTIGIGVYWLISELTCFDSYLEIKNIIQDKVKHMYK